MRQEDKSAASLCYELFKQSGKIGYYELYKKLKEEL